MNGEIYKKCYRRQHKRHKRIRTSTTRFKCYKRSCKFLISRLYFGFASWL